LKPKWNISLAHYYKNQHFVRVLKPVRAVNIQLKSFALQGAVKKSPYGAKQQSSTPQKKSVRDGVKDVRSKYESGRDKGTNKTRESSGSHTSKEMSQKEDWKESSSVREKLELLKHEAEKTRISSSTVKQDRTQQREPRYASRITEDKNMKPVLTSNRTPGRNPATGDAAPRRAQLSYHVTRSK
jgi:hypothetical protein